MSAVVALAACCAIVILLRFGPVGMSGGLSENTARMEDTAESAVCEDTENVTEQDDGEVDDLDAPASVESGASYNTDENEEKNAVRPLLRIRRESNPSSVPRPQRILRRFRIIPTPEFPLP